MSSSRRNSPPRGGTGALKWPVLLAVLFGLGLVAPVWALSTGKPAPAIEAKTFDGKTFRLDDHAGEVVILHFWASWCVPCRKEMPALETFYEKHREQGLALLAVSMDDPADEAKARAVMQQFSFPAAMMRDTRAKGYGRIWRIPLTFVIDRHGILRKDGWYGAPTLDLPELEQTVTPLLESR
jgi:cytochrome c biogenesis protein CcmG/thiol:disulfide interchange protein DsbE